MKQKATNNKNQDQQTGAKLQASNMHFQRNKDIKHASKGGKNGPKIF